jgi:hypothetical protein
MTMTCILLYTVCSNITLAFFHALKFVAKISVTFEKKNPIAEAHVYETHD